MSAKKVFSLLFIISVFLIFFGCIQNSKVVCGDGVCLSEEKSSCPLDCGATDSSSAKVLWKNSTPWGITDVTYYGNYLQFVLKNNSLDPLFFSSISVNGYIYSSYAELNPGESIVVKLVFDRSCTAQETIDIDRGSIIIKYDTEKSFAREQTGIANLSATCQSSSSFMTLYSDVPLKVNGIVGNDYNLVLVDFTIDSTSGKIYSNWNLFQGDTLVKSAQVGESKSLTMAFGNVFSEELYIEAIGLSGRGSDTFVVYKKS